MENKLPANRINWKLWTGLFLSALFLFLALRQVDFKKTGAIIISSDLKILVLVVIIPIIQYLIRTWRWGILLRPVKKTGFENRALSILTGFAANCVLPARLGEFIRANALGQAEKISKSTVFGTLVIERLFDGFVLLIILIIGLLFTKFPSELDYISTSIRGSAVLLLCIFIFLIVFIIGFRQRTYLFTGIIDMLLFMFSEETRKKIILIVENFALGLTPVKGVFSWCTVILWSLILWSLSLFQIRLAGLSIGLDLPFVTTFIIMGMLSIGVMVPSAPGFIGTFHLSVQYGFMLFGISAEKGFSAATLLHASFFFPTILLGMIAFNRLQKFYGKIDVGKEVKENS